MLNLEHLKSNRIFYYFSKISAIPRGSGNQKRIREFCVAFAKEHDLKFIQDDANNVIIYKQGTNGFENSEPIILQGHLDMVCQKNEGIEIDFANDGIDIYLDGDFIKARGTTLGADNGIAVSMMLSILEDDTISHPPIEAVFTTDEEIGMIGAGKLDFSHLKGKKMLNLDSEDPKTLTVSCAGGSECGVSLSVNRKQIYGQRVVLKLQGLKGGHSGVEINAGRVNADILAGRVLKTIKKAGKCHILSINGGDKGNAIPRNCCIELVVPDPVDFIEQVKDLLSSIQEEISDKEEGFVPTLEILEQDEFSVLDKESEEKLLFSLLHAPNGVIAMSANVSDLVETSLNLGIVKTEEDVVKMLFSLRSNKASALVFLEEELVHFFDYLGCNIDTYGHYPPWEFCKNSKMQALYQEVYEDYHGERPIVTAIHAGLECAVFAANIQGLDCISIGPEMYDIHTTNERLSVSSVDATYQIVLELLNRCK